MIGWLKRLFHREKSEWVQKKLVVTYWTPRENQAVLNLENLQFTTVTTSPYFIDSIMLKEVIE